ncbi:hypothetical protein Hamer_G027007 [Homarus americanus]|uniref:Uncharacterized protein n=1 Tax=Homarus americanus TaxID=6706 RepID=A0A8J5N987_HOMAM|nr:hypothetical protein Hamer_G027007 [Homarus americanus]
MRSLASGLTDSEGDGINCDETEKMGLDIQRSVDNQPNWPDHFMKKIDKYELASTIQMDLTNLIPKAEVQQLKREMPVIDGGWLLH